MKLPKLIDLFHRSRSEATSPAPAAAISNQEADMANTPPSVGPTQAPDKPTVNDAAAPAAAPSAAPSAAAAPEHAAGSPATLPAQSAAAATFAELNAEFSDDPAFIVDAQRQAMTMPQAHKAYAAKLKADNANLRKLGNAGASGEKPIPGGPAGSTPNATRQSPRAAVIAADKSGYLAEVDRVRAEKNISTAEATDLVNKERPDLRQKYLGRV